MACEHHTPCPSGYNDWQDWAKKKAKTHKQVKCPDCGLFAVWVPKKKVKGIAAEEYIRAAKVPADFPQMTFGNWRIDRVDCTIGNEGYDSFVCLRHLVKPVEVNYSNLHRVRDDGMMWDVVMEDSVSELSKHLPIWMNAKGHVLKTGLGLGCVVRGLLINPAVTKITVIEIDPDIFERVGEQFKGNDNVEIILADAMTFDYSTIDKVDYAWHDIWTPENKGLQVKHAELILTLGFDVIQGAWEMPRTMKRRFRKTMPSFIG